MRRRLEGGGGRGVSQCRNTLIFYIAMNVLAQYVYVCVFADFSAVSSGVPCVCVCVLRVPAKEGGGGVDEAIRERECV